MGSALLKSIIGAPRSFGVWGELVFIFMNLGSTGNHFQGFGEHARSFGDLGSPAKRKKKKISPKRKSLHFV